MPEAAGETGTRATVGMVVPSLDYYWPDVIRGVREAAAASGTRVVLRGATYQAADERRQLSWLVDSVGVDGLLVAPTTTGEDGEELVRWLSDTPADHPFRPLPRQLPHSGGTRSWSRYSARRRNRGRTTLTCDASRRTSREGCSALSGLHRAWTRSTPWPGPRTNHGRMTTGSGKGGAVECGPQARRHGMDRCSPSSGSTDRFNQITGRPQQPAG